MLKPPSSSGGVPTARSVTPSPSMSSMLATDLPKLSLVSTPVKPPAVDDIFWCDCTVPSAFKKSIQTAPLPALPSSSPDIPTAKSKTPSPSRSPIPATDSPNRSAASMVPVKFPARLEIFCSDFTVPSVFMNSIQTAPKKLPPVPPSRSECAPTAISVTPSPSRSPMFATALPKLLAEVRGPVKPP